MSDHIPTRHGPAFDRLTAERDAALARAAALEQERDEARRQLAEARKALSVISTTVAGLEKQSKPVINRSIKAIAGWCSAALKETVTP